MKHLSVLGLLGLMVCSPFAAATETAPHWGYEGDNGPQHWGKLSPEFLMCNDGKQQSPIDIVLNEVVEIDLDTVEFKYLPVTLQVSDTGQMIQMPVDNGGLLYIGCNGYRLLRIEFHTPGEIAIDGKRADMAMHLVHQNEDGKFTVLGINMTVGEEDNPLLAQVLANLPEKGAVNTVADTEVELGPLLPETDKGYYTYGGSLTTPPCTEGVRWLVMKDTTTLSAKQLARFQALYPDNARPLQPMYTRRVAGTLSTD